MKTPNGRDCRMLGSILRISCLLAAGIAAPLTAAELPAYRLDLGQTTVSGISSGAFMAVQFATAHSASVIGVAATAGGPYFCARGNALRALDHCMQGDPAFPAVPIRAADIDLLRTAAREWSDGGRIDELSNLGHQRVWTFHGYNDGIVKKAVSDALQQWYEGFVPSGQRFHKDNLPATHGQISSACTPEGVCSPCATVGKDFINACRDGVESAPLYDAAGSALQFFYGPLRRTDSRSLRGRMLIFDQAPYVRAGSGKDKPRAVGMAEQGYLYVPADCAAGRQCRLHIAFHGCLQHPARIGTAFVDNAGFNEWADANRIVVLYPQAQATSGWWFSPLNPQGCWDWWGYNDSFLHKSGRYATRDGTQIAAVWKMATQLAGTDSLHGAATRVDEPALSVIDHSATQLLLSWKLVDGAAGYYVYRQTGTDDWQQLTSAPLSGPAFVDHGLTPQSRYRYQLRTVDIEGNALSVSSVVSADTAAAPPPCDPYFSMRQGRPVDRNNAPVESVCP